jgi:REP element-mobilizing transposase RayT
MDPTAPPTFRGYRIDSARLRGWDYGARSWYFITICMRNRARALSHVAKGRVVLLPAGRIAARCWLGIAERQSGVALDRWVVLPDHFHGLIRPAPAEGLSGEAGPGMVAPVRQWRPGTVGVLINQFKRAVTLEVRRLGIPWPGWQPRFYDRIVRDERALMAIRRYIDMNPARYVASRSDAVRGPKW